MNVKPAVAVALLLTFLPFHSFAKPRPPTPPFPEAVLQHWTFDEPYYASFESNAPAIDSSMWAESWSGYALARTTRNVSAYSVPMAITNQWDVTPDQGAIRVWYSPVWATTTSRSTGPGQKATLLDLSLVSGSTVLPNWSLYATADGATLKLDFQGNAGVENVLSAGINWTANQWHLITVSYSGTQTLLYVDNALVALGPALPSLDAASAATAGRLTIGSSPNGNYAAQGLFDELTTFSQPIKESALNMYYSFCLPTVLLGPITPAEELAQQQKFVQAKAAQAAGLTTAVAGTMSLAMNPMTEYSTNLYLLSPQVQGTNIELTLGNANPSKSYIVYTASTLLDSNTVWISTIHGVTGQTNFTTPMIDTIQFYQAMENDSPGGGVPLVIIIQSPANGTVITQ